jgi:hypothetical protein
MHDNTKGHLKGGSAASNALMALQLDGFDAFVSKVA